MKKITILTFLFAVFAIAVDTKGFSKHNPAKRKNDSNPIQLDLQSKKNRLLFLKEAQKIRITYDFTALSSMQNKQVKKLVEDNIKIAIQFYSDLIKLKYPIQQPFRIPQDKMSCGYIYTFSEEQKQMEFKDTDLHILATFVDNPEESYLAYAQGCISDDTGRQILGVVNFNIGFITSLTDFDFQNSLLTTIHELFHVIAFDKILYPNFEITKGVKYSKDDYSNEQGLLKFPQVQKWARSHYNCQDLEGMLLENEGSEANMGVHWEKSILYDEIMNADGEDGYWSDLNNALLEDSGWYEVDRTFHDIITYGKGLGCDFVQNKCKSKKSYKEFCPKQKVKGPSNSYHAASVCSTQTYTDGCFIMETEKVCFNTKNNDNPQYQQYLEYFGHNSRVFYSSLTPLSITTNNDLQLMCYKYECIGNSKINVFLGDYKLECKSDFEMINSPDSKKFKGQLKCPDIKDFCSKQQKCPQFCSSKGYCIRGECVCRDGYTGPGCNCPPNQFYNAKTQSCSKCADEINCIHCDNSNSSVCLECKNGFFLQNGKCQKCSDSCKACSLSADKCMSCQQGFNLVNNKCSPCPKQCGVCSDSNNTQTCQSCMDGFGFGLYYQCTVKCSNNCKTCNGSAESCLTCKEGMYLKGSVCYCQEGTYFDSQSNTCKQCSHLCKKCSNGNSCDICVDTYSVDPKTKNCSKCQDMKYENSKGQCVACHYSCQTCFISPKTCTKCYDYSYMNSQNQCTCKNPNQFMEKDTNCVDCKQGCKTCESLDKCTSCEQDYYLKGSKCLQCPQGQYTNEKGECKPCHSSCSKCTGPLKNQCKV